jgi:AcrR family transcriptional regulator
MGRWKPDSQGRLMDAALELFGSQGFNETTAAQIAARAGVTERTFFRHFTDKRDVLFAGAQWLVDSMVAAVLRAPAGPPMEMVIGSLDAAASILGGSQEWAARRHAVIASTPELLEREQTKLSDYSALIAAALRRRDVPEPQATLAAETAMTILRVSLHDWATVDDGPPLSEVIATVLSDWRRMAG